MLFEVGVALAPTARLHFVVAVQVVECGLGDVDASTGRGGKQGEEGSRRECRTPAPMQNQTVSDSVSI